MALFARSRRRAAGIAAAALVALVALIPLSGAAAAGKPLPHPLPRPEAPGSAVASALLRPSSTHRYLGLAQSGVPQQADLLREAAGRIGKTPNLLEYYASFQENFNVQATRNAWNQGALTLLTWEPFTVPLADIAAGKDDAYLRKFAGQVRAANIPVALNFGHEMNGFWYPWGTRNKASDFVLAYRHIHQVFDRVGAKKVVWVWTANIVNHIPAVKLAPLYPGDAYVNWIGMSGYNEDWEHWTFGDVFGRTVAQIRTFSRKPLLIAETGVDATADQAARISDLFSYVAASHDIIGFVYFNYNQRMDWRFDADPASGALAAFQQGAASLQFGFDVRNSAAHG
ncbi:glycoside hydrolase family 26 protein [Streptacidiphilus sp. N1-3]|uniref:Glycoside hydrolase family 26 protein n=1 Tax=Streptacidiphilus alkalitolerans TaxID=3342712 RepID=A0ABV6X0G5_9ACTN